ncbi:MAG: peptide ABC transporter substrate-binding protein [Candidatus Saccharimonadales bacterium]
MADTEEIKKRWRKGIRRRRREAAALSQQADQNIDRLLLRRFDRLLSVRRFVLLWVALFILLIFSSVLQFRALSNYYQALQPIPGGLYNEGLVGTFSNANPLYASGTADSAISRLVFSGLFKYDNDNNLVGDLAKNWRVNDAKTSYTVNLKEKVSWHDGELFDADDVVFTYQSIQNIEAQSPLYASWRGIKVSIVSAYSVKFDLPGPLSPFIYSLTGGIIPKHLLSATPPEQLRSASFNTAPIGTGPFKWLSVEVVGANPAERQQRITLTAFDKYYGGPPKLEALSIVTFSDERQLTGAFAAKQVNAISGPESLPDELKNDADVRTYVTPLASSVMAFFNHSRQPLNELSVRRALISAVDKKGLPSLFEYPTRLADGPLLKDQLGYDRTLTQGGFNLEQANKLLDDAGFKIGEGGMRLKDGRPLILNLSSQDTQNYSKVSKFLQEQWARAGVKVEVNYYSGEDLQSTVIGNHDYDILLYGISIGVDPDVYAYWHSSQASLTSEGRLNLSEYKSPAADQAIGEGRTRSDPAIRAVKYQAFLRTWINDAPALALYQPNFLYITRGPVFGLERKAANSNLDRFYSVSDWMIRQKRQDTN